MIRSTFGGYMTAKLGLSAAQKGLYLTGQNLTNAGTEGYTRQRLDQVSINYGGTYRYASKYNTNIGNGVLVKGTSQIRDPFLDLRYRNEVAHTTEQSVKLDVLNDLRDILDEVKNAGEDSLGDGGIFNRIGDIIEKFKSYTSEIGSKEFDSMIRSSCQSLVTLFNAYSNRIDEVEENLKFDLENVDVPRVNKILESIQNLNKTIKSSEIIGQSALELKDERNLLIDELSEYMKINVRYKPINVTQSTVVDELHISLVGQDGNEYEIIADEQRREFILSEVDGKENLGLGAMTPVDQELKAALRTAQLTLEKAQTAYDNRNITYAAQHKNFATVQATKTQYEKDLADLQAQVEPAQEKMDRLTEEYHNALLAFDALPKDQQTDEEKQKVLDAALAREEAVNEYNTLSSNIRSAQATLDSYQSVYAKAKREYDEALADLDVNPNPLPKELDADGNPTGADITTDVYGNLLAGQGLAEKRLQEAKDGVTKALDALKQSEEKGKPIESINELLTDGKLKGELEMLNYSAEFDDPPNTIRGIGYYKSMLDTLANKFAEAMNEANNPYQFTVQKVDPDTGKPLYSNYDLKDGEYVYNKLVRLDADGNPAKDADGNIIDIDGNPIYTKDSNGNELYDKDSNGNVIYINVVNADGSPVYQKDAAGNIVMQDKLDADGNPIYEERLMFNDDGTPTMVPKYEQVLDKYKNPVFDENGDPVMDVAYELEPGNEYEEIEITVGWKEQIGADGKPVLGPDGKPVLDPVTETIYRPNYVYEDMKDADGNPVLDETGQPVQTRVVIREQAKETVKVQEPAPLKIKAPAKDPQMETVANDGTERHDLFKSKDGGKIVAGNIDLADGWVDRTYGITTALNPDDPSGNNTNVLHFINMLNGKLNYKADVNLLEGIEIDFNTTANGATTKEPNISGMTQGDTITIDGKTYTFVPNATGRSGNEFCDFDSLKTAAEMNGVTLTRTPDADDGVITATTVKKDLKYDIQVNGGTISSLSQLKPDNLTYGDTITIDGVTYTYKPEKYPDSIDGTVAGATYADPDKNEFSSLDSFIAVAANNNIEVTVDGNNAITGVGKMDGKPVSASISVSKAPSIASMVTGNTLTIDNDKVFTYVDPADVKAITDAGTGSITIGGRTFTYAAGADGSDGSTFSDMASLVKAAGTGDETATPPVTPINLFSDADSLKEAASKQGLTLYVDPKTNKITTATKPGSNLFDGTFEEYYVNLDATLGMDIKSTTEKLDNYSTLAGSIYDERESVTGVSHDEEAMNLMRYQQSYQAASRLMTTLDQVLDILLTQTGMVGR